MDLPRSEQSDIEPMQAAEDVIASQDALIIIFQQIENFFIPLGEYAEVPTTEALKDIMVKIMVELFEIFGIMTKEIKQGRASESISDYMFPDVDRGSEMSRKNFFQNLLGRKGLEHALSRLDRLTREATILAAGTEEGQRSWFLSLASRYRD